MEEFRIKAIENLRKNNINFDLLDIPVQELLISYEVNSLKDKFFQSRRFIKHKPKKEKPNYYRLSYDKFIKTTLEDGRAEWCADLSTYLPTLDMMVGYKEEFLNFIQKVQNKKNFSSLRTCYVYFYLEKDNKIFASTRVTGISISSYERDVARSLEYLSDLIEKIRSNIYGYEYVFTSRSTGHTFAKFQFFYTLIPKSIINWGLDEKYYSFTFCDLFCANEIDIDCITQCSYFLWQVEISDLDEFISYGGDKLVIIEPKEYIRDIKDIQGFYDFKISHLSKNNSLDFYSDKSFVLYFKSHLGVLCNFKYNKEILRRSTIGRAFKNTQVDFVTVCFDIECYFDPNDALLQANIPYMCCFCYVIDNVVSDVETYIGRDCILKMLNDISFNNSFNKVELIAHNGGNYDFHYILSSLINPTTIKNILIRNNSFISFEFDIENTTFLVKDSYSFLLCSLANAAKAFLDNSVYKTSFPHHLIKTLQDLEKIEKDWDDVEDNIVIDKQENKMFITAKHVIKYKEDGESKKLIEWAKEYCVNDVIVLANVWLKFKQTTFEIFEFNIVDQSYTLAGLSFNLFKNFLSKSIFLIHPKKDDYINIRDALIGGRCISVNGIYKDILCLDVKSLYPAAMAYYDQPYGKMYSTTSRNPDKLGIYYCKITISGKNVRNGFFPIRVNNITNYSYTSSNELIYNHWYTSVDIDIAIEEGHTIKILHGYEWEQRGQIFKDYIENVLYKYKLQFEQERNKVKRQVIKIIMNSLWGKFAQKWIDSSYIIKDNFDINPYSDFAKPIWDTDYVIVKETVEKNVGSKPVQNGVFTLSWARWHMKKLWDAAALEEAECIYSDTDSIFVRRSDFNLNAEFKFNNRLQKVIGSEMGQLELEAELDGLMCAGKKQYFGFKKLENKIIKKARFKGIPSKFISSDMFSFLLQSRDNKVIVEFLKFRREWGSVRGYMESKEVKAN